MGYDLKNEEFPIVAAGFLPGVASPSVVGVKLLGVAGIIHPGVGLWRLTLSNGVGASSYIFVANTQQVSVGQLSVCCQDTGGTPELTKDITIFNIGAAQDQAVSFMIRRILT